MHHDELHSAAPPTDTVKVEAPELVQHVVRELQQRPSFDEQAILVQLDGRIHTDDRLALKQITKQLGLEAAVGDRVFQSFAENLNFLLQCLKSGVRESSKCVIFIMEEFDLFCGHHNQTLLYNLFDVAQSAQILGESDVSGHRRIQVHALALILVLSSGRTLLYSVNLSSYDFGGSAGE
ncbi:hypothetical protein PR048_028687 [Dryococelus australis]|uniref:Origin recognition complex subunit 4 n=1 Tax=Dryococelus australis TaxID=614101 RepID=A0ABQ9GB98_9NEOP|nr:hypothetical protein PR048_028687 [Dryococelus australis]